MGRSALWLLPLVAVVSAAATWLLMDVRAPDAPPRVQEDALRIAELEADVARLIEQGRRTEALRASATGAGSPPGSVETDIAQALADDAAAGAADAERRDSIAKSPRLGSSRRGPSLPKNVPPGMRGTPKMWLDGMRIALDKGDAELASYYRLALVALGPEAVPAALDALLDRGASDALRLQAMHALAVLDHDALVVAAAEWLSALREPSAIRTEMLKALSNSEAEIPKAVVDIAWDSEAPAADRLSAIQTLARNRPDDATDLLRRMLRNESAASHETAVSVLAKTRDPRLRPVVEEAIDEGDLKTQRKLIVALAAMKGAAWGNVQMTGPPDCPLPGDNHTAWASKHADEGEVVVELDFPHAVVPESVRIHETFNPGAIVRVDALIQGRVVLLWSGEAGAAGSQRWFAPSLATIDAETRTIRLTLDTNAVKGWNEIDAVELIGGGRNQWAEAARSSSCYAQ